MKKISIAPGEMGRFKNWGEDIYLEEMAFPDKFPFGCGGYLSSCIDDKTFDMGFARYCVNQVMSADPKFRQDKDYIFFLTIVKELIILKHCKSTFFRQARRLPSLNKNSLNNLDRENMVRYNRCYQAFENLRGSPMYFEHSKKNLMACLRQNGCPSIFLTLSSAEFDWPDLVKQIAETVYRRQFTMQEIESMSDKEKNKLISDNVVITTMHFQKRIENFFSIIGYPFFEVGSKKYHSSSYFYRVEFQQRGAPHVHSLIWLKDQDNVEAPSFWYSEESDNMKESTHQKNRLSLSKKRRKV